MAVDMVGGVPQVRTVVVLVDMEVMVMEWEVMEALKVMVGTMVMDMEDMHNPMVILMITNHETAVDIPHIQPHKRIMGSKLVLMEHTLAIPGQIDRTILIADEQMIV